MSSEKHTQNGFILPTVLSFILAGLIFAGVVAEVIYTNFFIVNNNAQSQEAFNIAEAGVNYYLWHLSHNANDFKDGQSTPATPDPNLGYGPYTHDYIDDNAVNEGTYTLWVKPHGNGSTLVDVRAIGKVKGTDITRTVQAQIGATSFADYGVVSDSALWFGANETADGPVHSNVGVRMDGSSNDTVSSSNATYVPTTNNGGDNSTSHPGVWCDPSVTTPVDCNTRSKSNWVYPTTSVDFNQVSSSLCTLKKKAFSEDSSTSSLATQSNACSQTPGSRTPAYLPQRGFFASSFRGYLIELNPDGTYNLSSVNNEIDIRSNYTSALNIQPIATNIAIPSDGVIFAEDNVWIRSNPTFHGRVTVAAGRLANYGTANINIVDNLAYSAKDGSDAIGLVSEGSIYVDPYAAPPTGAASSTDFTLEIDGALLAESGDVAYRPDYIFNWFWCTRGYIDPSEKLHFYGSVATRQTWTWSWLSGYDCGDGVYDSTLGQYVSGFENNTTEYDYNLRYAPPPSYPITGGYSILNWREILTKP